MRLFEAVLAANQRWLSGERGARVPAEVTSALPIAALTCIDARLNHLLPDALGVPEEQFIWLRNAGNIITGPLSSTMRSLALACAVKGAKEIAIIGHTDCLVGRTTALQLLDRLSALGIDRNRLPQNLVEYFGLFATERQNVLRGVECVRASPLIGPKIPVHGLLLDVKTGALEWVANGYAAPDPKVGGPAGELCARANQTLDALEQIGHFATSELKLPDAKIGEFVSTTRDWLHQAEHVAAALTPAKSAGAASPASPPVSPVPPAPPYLHQTGTSFSELVRKRMQQRKAESDRRR